MADSGRDNRDYLVAGNQSWGHAYSPDLYTWINDKIAICPNDLSEQIFSGSIVVDSQDSSGLFPSQTDGIVAVYTRNTDQAETQEIAWSIDAGTTFTRYANNPVIPSTSTQFRDPKVSWNWTIEKWLMVVAYSQDFTVGFFTSPDLKTWTWASNFTHHGLLGLQWECPNFVRLPIEGTSDKMWVLFISINPGAPLGGSTMQYIPGTFDDTTFTPIDGVARIADFGKDFYAGQFFEGTDDVPVMIAWASNWQYCEDVPTDSENWRSVMTLPRQVSLQKDLERIGYNLISYPAILDIWKFNSNSLPNNPPVPPPVGVIASFDYSSAASGAVWFELDVSGLDGSASGQLVFNFSSSATQEYVVGGYHFSGDYPVWVDRASGLKGWKNDFFTDKMSSNVLPRADGTFSVHGMIDRTILELFFNGGQLSATNTFYPQGKLDTLTIYLINASSNTKVSSSAWAINGIWQ